MQQLKTMQIIRWFWRFSLGLNVLLYNVLIDNLTQQTKQWWTSAQNSLIVGLQLFIIILGLPTPKWPNPKLFLLIRKQQN